MCVFVAFDIKPVHLEPVSDLTSTAFIATFQRLSARRGKPSVMWSDHRTNFIGAARELKELHEFAIVQGLRIASLHFVPSKEYTDTLYQNMRHILEGYGRRQLRV